MAHTMSYQPSHWHSIRIFARETHALIVTLKLLAQVGDQLVRINGYAVDDAVHRELSQYVACQDRLTLKVRGKLGVHARGHPDNYG